MAGLIVVDVIHVVTQLGGCDIELCFGDIVKLPVKDKVDVVVASAFRGNYMPTAGSLIGALKRDLGIDVFKLAADKAEDLRDVHHCWWSQKLPEHLPFKRLMCFEAKHTGFSRPQELVGDVFRCLIPILKNQDGSVITPLLNTGSQGHNEKSMMNGMVEAAVNWMKAGLPLRKLKIVVYASKVSNKELLLKKNEQLCQLFEKLKGNYGMKELQRKNVPIEYDVYLSTSKEDENIATVIKDKLRLAKPDIRIFGSQHEVNKEEVWQKDMYEVMIRCARVITVLTPHYLQSVSCMEQYNMALCCNRTAQRDMLAPFYAEPITDMPTYMGLVQYVDCLVKDTEKISAACVQLIATLDVKVHAEVMYEQPKLAYDVFISYSHRNADRAAEVIKCVKALDANLKVFFDTEELKTGATWQQMLYHAIDGTKCFIAVVTKEYLLSPVCQEEFNLSLSKHCQKSDQLIMVPFLVDDDLDDLPLEFKQIQLVKATGELFTPAIQATCTAIFQHLRGQKSKMQNLFTKPKESPDILKSQEKLRRTCLCARYNLNDRWYKKVFPWDLESFYLKEEEKVGLAKVEEIEGDGEKEKERKMEKDVKGKLLADKSIIAEDKKEEKGRKKENDLKEADGKGQELLDEKEENVGLQLDKNVVTEGMKEENGSKKETDGKRPELLEGEMENVQIDKNELFDLEKRDNNLSEITNDVKEENRKIENVIERTDEKRPELLKLEETVQIDKEEEDAVKELDNVRYDIAVSCTQSDLKFASYFIDMIKEFSPHLKVASSDCSDQEKRSILESASKIVAFVSPSYTESPPHMEELNIALCRHRFSPQPILFAIQLHMLPRLPSYLHLIPYRFCLEDEIWKEIIKKIEKDGAETHRQIRLTRKSMDLYLRVSVEAAISLAIAAGDLLNDIRNERTTLDSKCPRSVLGNIARFQADVKEQSKVNLISQRISHSEVKGQSEVNDPDLSKLLFTIILPKDSIKNKNVKEEETTSKTKITVRPEQNKEKNLNNSNSKCDVL
ncbi:uncharacterized protein [Antedon mediterranea]|uniref:uncharacterized protein n=1 Tax=Antedon mediterranea TaxID=105859 RepID=UPI003AF46429